MDLGLSGKVAMVTGGSGSIGRAIVAALRDEGGRVVVVDRDPSPDAGGDLHVVKVTSPRGQPASAPWARPSSALANSTCW